MPETPTPASESASPQLESLIQEIQQTPPAQWAHLLEILRIFRQSVTVSPPPDTTSTPINQAAIDLLRSWREEGDEAEQRETWEFLQQALDEDRLSDRPLFPPS
jgi:hypothetical protein